MSAPPIQRISEWEAGQHAPAHEYRVALARIARRQKATEDLAPVFLASIDTWDVIRILCSLSRAWGIAKGHKEHLRTNTPADEAGAIL